MAKIVEKIYMIKERQELHDEYCNLLKNIKYYENLLKIVEKLIIEKQEKIMKKKIINH